MRQGHLDEVKDEVAWLTALHDGLKTMVTCGHRRISQCQIIEGLADHRKRP